MIDRDTLRKQLTDTLDSLNREHKHVVGYEPRHPSEWVDRVNTQLKLATVIRHVATALRELNR